MDSTSRFRRNRIPCDAQSCGLQPHLLRHIERPFTLTGWYEAVRRGDSFVTNGPVLFFHSRRHGSRVTVDVTARAREPIDRVEIVANGKVIQSWKPGKGAKCFRGFASLPIGNHSWMAARCFLTTDYAVRLAHSSPVYLDGKWDAHEDALYFVEWIDGLIAHVHAEANRHMLSSEQADQLIATYRKARAIYASK